MADTVFEDGGGSSSVCILQTTRPSFANASTVEGLFTIFVSFLLSLLLPGSPDLTRPLLSPGIIKFSDSEKEILQKRLEQDTGGSAEGAYGVHIPLKVVFRTVACYRRWPHFISTFVVFSTWSPLTTYTPTIIM